MRRMKVGWGGKPGRVLGVALTITALPGAVSAQGEAGSGTEESASPELSETPPELAGVSEEPDGGPIASEENVGAGPEPTAGASPADEETESPVPPAPVAVEGGSSPSPAKKPSPAELAVRLGYAIPGGDFTSGNPLAETVGGMVPLQFDGIARWGHFGLGMYARAGIGFHGSDYDGCSGCAPLTLAGGFQAVAHTMPRGPVDVWGGVGLGLNLLNVTGGVTLTGTDSSGNPVDLAGTVSMTMLAFPELIAQAGVDFGSGRFRIGPFINLIFAQYWSGSIEVRCTDIRCGGQGTRFEGEVDDKAFHFWTNLGVKASFVAL